MRVFLSNEYSVSLATVLILFVIDIVNTQLLINVKNQGGDVVQEAIWSNGTEDTVTLEFQRPDGTLITQLIDFTNEVQILKAIVLGEEERGQSQYQVMCFLIHADKTEFISADAMAKLRQKNPGTIRSAEVDRGRSNHTMSAWVLPGRASSLSRLAPALCAEAGEAVYTSDVDLHAWAQLSGTSIDIFKDDIKPFPERAPPCAGSRENRAPCRCRLEVCVGWYPCGLKYCKGRGPPAAAPLSYRCGINTCKRCQLFEYHVHKKHYCLWDE